MADATGDPALGRRIRDARMRAGLSQEQLAERLGWTKQTYSSRERGQRMPSPLDVADIARTLGVTTDELLIGRPLVPNDDEQLLLFAYRHAAPQARRSMMASARAIAEESAEYSANPRGASDATSA